MLFICGIVDFRAGDDLREIPVVMAAARRSARDKQVSKLALTSGAIIHANASPTRASAGETTVVLYRPVGEELDTDVVSAQTIAASCQRSGALDLSALRGAFVLVAVDGVRERAYLATDRFAVCPVHVYASNGRLVFSSDLDALTAQPGFVRKLDPQAIYDYVYFHCIPSPRTIYKGIEKLGPASVLEWHRGACRQSPYWIPTFAPAGKSIETYGAELRDKLDSAVLRRTRPQCGAFLSGGLDSSSVAGALRKTTGAAATFTIGFDAAAYDESGYARIAAEHFRTHHHEYFVTPDDIRQSLPEIAAYCAEPFGNSSVLPTYHCARFARDHGIAVLLAGDGGDELFAGNTRYLDQKVFERYFSLPKSLRFMLETGYQLLPWLKSLPISGKGDRYIKQALMGLPDRLQSYNFLHRFDPATVFGADWLRGVDTESPWRSWRQRFREPEAGSSLQRMLYLDWKFTLADNDLVKVTRMCDFAGVDVCYPMLDDELVFLSEQISDSELLLGGELRGFYKHAFANVLPQTILKKSKHGFGLPFGEWLCNDAGLKQMTTNAFASLRQRDIFKIEFIDQAQKLYEQSDAAGYYGELVWVLMMLELWLGAHG